MRRCHATELPSYLDEFMWRERYGKTAGEAFRSIMADIAAFYPVWTPICSWAVGFNHFLYLLMVTHSSIIECPVDFIFLSIHLSQPVDLSFKSISSIIYESSTPHTRSVLRIPRQQVHFKQVPHHILGRSSGFQGSKSISSIIKVPHHVLGQFSRFQGSNM